MQAPSLPRERLAWRLPCLGLGLTEDAQAMPTTWTAAVWQHFHAGALTRAHRDVLLTLRTYRGHGGDCWPAHETVAARARCSPSTVLRALRQARELGLVRWAERRVRAGWRWLRSSNAYRFILPDRPPKPRARACRRTDRQKAGGEESQRNQGRSAPSVPASWQPSEAERRAAQAALSAVRATRAGTIASLLTGKRATARPAGGPQA